MNTPEQFANFYDHLLNIDLNLVYKGFLKFKKFFRGKTALELGPASGYMTKYLVECFDKLTIVEGSKTLIDQIPDYVNVEKINCLFEDYTPYNTYDTIIINHVLEHIDEPIRFLSKVCEWLSDDGICILGVPNAKSFHRLAAVKMGLLSSEYDLNSRDLELGHCRVYDLNLLKEHAVAAKFKIKQEGGIFLKFLSNSQIEQFLPEEVIDAYFELADDFYLNSAEIFLILEK